MKAIIAVIAAGIPGLVSSQHAITNPIWLSREKQANLANCVVNIGIASTMLGKAGVAINGAVKYCGTDNAGAQEACTASVSGVIAAFGFGAGFISASAAECRASMKIVNADKVLMEACAATTSVLTATLALMVNAGATIQDSCPGVRPIQHDFLPEGKEGKKKKKDDDLPPLPEGMLLKRRLSLEANKTMIYEKIANARAKLLNSSLDFPRGMKDKKPRTPRTDAQNAACAFDVGQFTFFMARAGLMINYAVTDCSAQHLYTGGNLNQAKCIADVGRAIGAFGYTASGIAMAVYECPDIMDNLGAVCAGAIANMVSATSELVANGADIYPTCAQLGQGEAKEEEIVGSLAGVERRLASDISADPGEASNFI